MLFSEGWELFGSYGSFYYLSEIANYLFLVLILFIFIHFRLIDKKYSTFWLLFLSTPFFFNFILFNPEYLSDQFKYIREINNIKSNGLTDVDVSTYGGLKRARIQLSSFLLSLFPVFSYLTVTSLAFTNKLIAMIMFVFLSKRIPANKVILFFLIPSFILFTSVGLREVLVIFFSILSIIYLIEEKPALSFIAILLVTVTKIQNGPAYLVIWLLFFVFKAYKDNLRLLLSLAFGVIGIIVLFEFYEPVINLYRQAYAIEDGLTYEEAMTLGIGSGISLMLTTLKEIPIFLLKPLPWQISNGFALFVFIESVFLFYLFYLFAFKDGFFLKRKNLIILIGFIIGIGIHALTVFNFGTLSRYRFTAFLPFLIGFYYLRLLDNDKKKTA
tara:strand:+ start:48968 stop:50122 length:1155 start_codon:yes stop_codon:yes gene_type:complete